MSRQVDLSKGALANEASEMVVADGLEVLVAKLVEQLLVGAGQLGLALMVSACLLHYFPVFAWGPSRYAGFPFLLRPFTFFFSASSSLFSLRPSPDRGCVDGSGNQSTRAPGLRRSVTDDVQSTGAASQWASQLGSHEMEQSMEEQRAGVRNHGTDGRIDRVVDWNQAAAAAFRGRAGGHVGMR